MFKRLLCTITALLAIAAATSAQPHNADLIVGGQYPTLTGGMERLTLGGRLSPVYLPANGSFPTWFTMDIDNQHVVAPFADFFGTTLDILRIDASTKKVVATVWKAPPLPSLLFTWIEPDQNGDYLLVEGAGRVTPALYRLKRNGSSLTSLLVGGANSFFSVAIEDKMTGDYFIGEVSNPNSPRLLQVDRDSLTIKRTITLPGPAMGVWSMAQDPHRPDIYVAGNVLQRLDPATGAVTTLVTSLGGLPVVSVGVDRGPGANGAMLQAGLVDWNGGGPVHRLDRKGTDLGRIGKPGFFGTSTVVHHRGRNLAAELKSAPNHRELRVSFPGGSGKRFAVALSLSGYTPGTTIADGRVIPLNVDDLTILTLTKPLGPLFSGNLGPLDQNGEARVTMNLNPLGNTLAGIRIWAAAVTIDPQAPAGLGAIGAPLLLVL